MPSRRLLLTLVPSTAVALLFCCGPAPKKPASAKDAGAAPSEDARIECFDSAECAAGDCIELRCVSCEAKPCAAGKTCGANGKCVGAGGCDGGCAAADTGGGASDCKTRADCAANLACRGGKCLPPDPNGSCTRTDECPRGSICNFNVCSPGCESSSDCLSNAAGPRCDPATNQCGPCKTASDCAVGEACNAGKCEQPKTCADRSVCGDRACIGGLCKDCTAGSDCGASFNCNQGKCEAKSGCTDDQQCRTLSPGHFCNKGTGQCEWGCLPGPSANCGQNCCAGGQTCNSATHQCEGTCNNCGNSCAPSQVCDTVKCVCIGSAGSDGGTSAGDGGGSVPTVCDKACGCSGGRACTCAGKPCDPIFGPLLFCPMGIGLCQ